MSQIVSKAASAILKNHKDAKLDEEAIVNLIETQIKGGNLPESTKICPECERNFALISAAGLELECCIYCKSLWFDAGELRNLTGLSKDIPADNLAHRKSNIKCPVCRQQMREYLFMPRHNLLVDKCPDEHGIYLQGGELKRVFSLAK